MQYLYIDLVHLNRKANWVRSYETNCVKIYFKYIKTSVQGFQINVGNFLFMYIRSRQIGKLIYYFTLIMMLEREQQQFTVTLSIISFLNRLPKGRSFWIRRNIFCQRVQIMGSIRKLLTSYINLFNLNNHVYNKWASNPIPC